MGYMAHHAVIVTGYDVQGPAAVALDAFRERLHNRPKGILVEDFGDLLVGPVQSLTNGYWSFALLPDGSKEGWGTSDGGDAVRAELVDLAQHFELDYVVVRYGGDEPDLATVEQHDQRTVG